MPYRVLIFGYHGFGNVGDEAVLQAMTSDLIELEPTLEITVVSAAPRETTRLTSLHAIDRRDTRAIKDAIRRSDLYIVGGGSLLQDATSFDSIEYYAERIRWGISCGTPVMLYANGLGPVIRKDSKALLASLIPEISLITLRDQDSANLLMQLESTMDDVIVLADPVFSLEASSESDRIMDVIQRARVRRSTTIGICLRSFPNRQVDYKEWARALKSLCYETQATLLILPFMPVADYPIIREVRKWFGDSEDLQVAPWNLSPREWLSLIGRLDLVVSVRLHALMLATMVDTPFLAINYDPKVPGYVHSLGLERFVFAGLSDQIVEPAGELLRNPEAQLAVFKANLPSLRSKAKRNARLALEILKRGS